MRGLRSIISRSFASLLAVVIVLSLVFTAILTQVNDSQFLTLLLAAFVSLCLGLTAVVAAYHDDLYVRASREEREKRNKQRKKEGHPLLPHLRTRDRVIFCILWALACLPAFIYIGLQAITVQFHEVSRVAKSTSFISETVSLKRRQH